MCIAGMAVASRRLCPHIFPLIWRLITQGKVKNNIFLHKEFLKGMFAPRNLVYKVYRMRDCNRDSGGKKNIAPQRCKNRKV